MMHTHTRTPSGKAPTSFKVEVYFFSRDYRVLFGLVAAILLVGVLLAMKESGRKIALEEARWSKVNPGRIAQPLPQLHRLLSEPDAPLADDVRANEVAILLWALETQSYSEKGAEAWAKALQMIEASPQPAARKQLYLEFGKSLASRSRLPSATLLTLAYRQQLPAANYLTALLYLRAEDKDRTRWFLARESTFPQSSLAREMALELAMEQRDVPVLEQMAADPLYFNEWTPAAAVKLAMEKHDWITTTINLFRLQWTTIDPGIIVLTLLSGTIWFLIWLQAIQVREATGARLGLCLSAFLLGVISTTPTLLLVVASERYLGLVEGQGLMSDIAYYLLGVGPREEFCKWLALLPLVPTLIQRGNRLEMLIVSGFVGLGFAVTENFSYFSEYATAAYTRFLTANFFHVAATALIGLSFMETCINPRKYWWLFPVCFLQVSLLHGIYDVFIAIEALEAVQIFSSVAFVFLALGFFRKLRQYRSLETNYLWMPASIVLGLTVVMAATLVEASARMGFNIAMVVLAYQSITFSMIVYLFIWQTRNLRYDADL